MQSHQPQNRNPWQTVSHQSSELRAMRRGNPPDVTGLTAQETGLRTQPQTAAIRSHLPVFATGLPVQPLSPDKPVWHPFPGITATKHWLLTGMICLTCQGSTERNVSRTASAVSRSFAKGFANAFARKSVNTIFACSLGTSQIGEHSQTPSQLSSNCPCRTTKQDNSK